MYCISQVAWKIQLLTITQYNLIKLTLHITLNHFTILVRWCICFCKWVKGLLHVHFIPFPPDMSLFSLLIFSATASNALCCSAILCPYVLILPHCPPAIVLRGWLCPDLLLLHQLVLLLPSSGTFHLSLLFDCCISIHSSPPAIVVTLLYCHCQIIVVIVIIIISSSKYIIILLLYHHSHCGSLYLFINIIRPPCCIVIVLSYCCRHSWLLYSHPGQSSILSAWPHGPCHLSSSSPIHTMSFKFI